MANPPYNTQYQQNMHGMPPLQTQGSSVQNQQRAYSPQSYQPSPGAMSPTSGGIPPAKRQRLSPQPMSPYSSQYNSPFTNSNPQYSTSPYSGSPPSNQFLSLPHSPATTQPSTPSFHQPQPYHHPNMLADHRPQFAGSMPPPKVPASKAHKDDELEKGNAKDSNPNALADIITNSGIDLQREEEALHEHPRNYNSFNSQGSASTLSPHGSFNQWGQQANHGAFQGTGPLSQPVTEEQLAEELKRKHANVARIQSEAASHPLTDPFLLAAGVRQRLSRRAYENGVKLDLEGLFDKIPSAVPQNVARREMSSSNGEAIVELEATSLLNNGAPLVDLVSLISLATEERARSMIEDAYRLSLGRQNTSDGIVPPEFADIAKRKGVVRRVDVAYPNISGTAWEASDGAGSPTTRNLPTPPSDGSQPLRPTIQFMTNPVVDMLNRQVAEDEKFEKIRIAKRQKRLQGNSETPTDAAASAPIEFPVNKISKKERDRMNKASNTEEAQHARTNLTAASFMSTKKKYSWLDADKGGSGSSTPRATSKTAGGSVSGTITPAEKQKNAALRAIKRTWLGGALERGKEGAKIQMRDFMHVLREDGREKRLIEKLQARVRTSEEDAKTIEDRPKIVTAPVAPPSAVPTNPSTAPGPQ